MPGPWRGWGMGMDLFGGTFGWRGGTVWQQLTLLLSLTEPVGFRR
jgi:hypothetical protein